MATVLICDDHVVVSAAVGAVIEQAPDLELVSPPAQDPLEAIRLAEVHAPDVVLMDVELHGPIDGLEAARRIRARSTAPVIIFTARNQDSVVVDAVEAGACGVVRKSEPVEVLVSAIQSAARGELLISGTQLADILPLVADRRERSRATRELVERLTQRELEVLGLLAKGTSTTQIARELVVTDATAQTHIRNVLSKLHVSSRLEAVVLGVRSGLVEMR